MRKAKVREVSKGREMRLPQEVKCGNHIYALAIYKKGGHTSVCGSTHPCLSILTRTKNQPALTYSRPTHLASLTSRIDTAWRN